MEEAPGVVSVVMRDAIGGGAYRGVRKAGVEGHPNPKVEMSKMACLRLQMVVIVIVIVISNMTLFGCASRLRILPVGF